MNGIPVLSIEGECFTCAWENSLMMLCEWGCDLGTQYVFRITTSLSREFSQR